MRGTRIWSTRRNSPCFLYVLLFPYLNILGAMNNPRSSNAATAPREVPAMIPTFLDAGLTCTVGLTHWKSLFDMLTTFLHTTSFRALRRTTLPRPVGSESRTARVVAPNPEIPAWAIELEYNVRGQGADQGTYSKVFTAFDGPVKMLVFSVSATTSRAVLLEGDAARIILLSTLPVDATVVLAYNLAAYTVTYCKFAENPFEIGVLPDVEGRRRR